jgi:hypothetical protein
LVVSECACFRHRTFALVMPRVDQWPALAGPNNRLNLMDRTLGKQVALS